MVGTYNTLLCAKTNFREQMYGALLVDYTHEFDFLRAIFGEVRDVHCWTNDLGSKEKRCRPALAATTMRFESGAIVSVHMDYVQHPQRRSVEVFGDRKTVALDLQTDRMKIFDASREGHQVLSFDNVRDDRLRAEHQDFFDAAQKGNRPRVDGEAGLRVLEVAEQAIARIRRR